MHNELTVTYRLQSKHRDDWTNWVGVYTTEREIRQKLRDVEDEGCWKRDEVRMVRFTTSTITQVLT